MSNDKDASPPEPEDRLVSTAHEVRIDGRRIRYRATTGLIVLREEAEEDGKSQGHMARAEVFVTAYTREDAGDPAERPITFAFNGGPGSSSVWLHLGVLGPRRVELEGDGSAPRAPYRLVENEWSLLDRTDLVFIDPVSTGYSRAVKGEKAGEYHGYRGDLESVAEVIRLWLSRNGRWRSPKYLAGESYGTTRAAGLAAHLQQRHGIYPDGLMLLSSVLDFSTVRFDPGNDLPPLLYVPSYAATAWYHGRLGPDLQQKPLAGLLQEVEAFTYDRYAPALLRGSRLGADEAGEVAGQLARYLGVSKEFVARNNLRISIDRFCKELLRDRRRTVGRLDSRFLGIDRDAGGGSFEHDPSYSEIQAPYTALLNDYVRNELGFESDLPYEIIKDLYRNWKYSDFENRYVNTAEELRKAMATNPHLRVHVASGYFDLATPYFATEHTFDHLGLEPEQLGNVSKSYYEAGHMMYIELESLKKLKAELDAWLS